MSPSGGTLGSGAGSITFTPTGTSPGQPLIDEDFDSDEGDFEYSDDVFFPGGLQNGNPASGDRPNPNGFGSDNVLRVSLGGNSTPDSATNMNGAWTRTFTLTQTTTLTISFAYLLTLSGSTEAGENAQLLMSVGGTQYTVAQLVGQSGDLSHSVENNYEAEITLGPGTHTLALGGYMNSKDAIMSWQPPDSTMSG